MSVPAEAAALVAVLGLAIGFAGWIAVVRFARNPAPRPRDCPPVTILRPLCGDEPLLDEALASCCAQDYPTLQIVFGLHDRDDPALAAVDRVRRRFPAADVAVVVERARGGSNRKVANLINMLSAAHHDILAVSDSDLHLPPGYITALVGELEQPGIGLVTAPYLGRAARPAIAAWLGTSGIDYGFLPGFLLARAFGRRDCLGSTMMLRRETLERAGGFGAIANCLAEDNILGQRIGALGLDVGLARTVPSTTVAETSLRDLWSHETRWMKTIRALAPLGLPLSAVQYPLFWAALAIVLSGGTTRTIAVYLATWCLRGAYGLGVAHTLRQSIRHSCPLILLLPLREILSVMEIAASYTGDTALWRGHTMAVE